MHSNSHPEYKESQPSSVESSESVKSVVDSVPYNNPALSLRERLRLYIDTHAPVEGGRAGSQDPFSMADAARELGYSASMISKYLGDKLKGVDCSALEDAIADLLAQAPTRDSQVHFKHLFPTAVSQIVEATFERVRRIDDIALICGPAGAGKTCACHLYKQTNPTCLFITATRWMRDASGLQSLLFEAVGKHGWNGHEARMQYAQRKLRDSHRLVIIDNAHRLTTGAIELVCDAQDEAGFSVALVGNESVLETIRRSDQLLSRIGVKKPVFVSAPKVNGRAKGNALNLQQSVRKMIEIHAPETNGQSEEVAALGEVVASKQGHLRALKKQLVLTKEIKAATSLDWPDSFRSAHGQLIRDYTLD